MDLGDAVEIIDGKCSVPQRLGKYRCPVCKEEFSDEIDMKTHFENNKNCKMMSGLLLNYVESVIENELLGKGR